MLSLDSASSRLHRTNKFHAVILGGFSAITNNIEEETDITLACVATVSVLFRSKERPRNEILGFGRARNETSAKKNERVGRGRKETFLPFFPTFSPLTRAIFREVVVARSLTLGTARKRLLRRLI